MNKEQADQLIKDNEHFIGKQVKYDNDIWDFKKFITEKINDKYFVKVRLERKPASSIDAPFDSPDDFVIL